MKKDLKQFFGLEWPRAAGAAFAGLNDSEAKAKAQELGISISWTRKGGAPRLG